MDKTPEFAYRLLGMRLRQLRGDRKLTRPQVASESGLLVRGTLLRMELGRVRFRLRTVRRLLDCYEATEEERCDVEHLLRTVHQHRAYGVCPDSGPGRWNRLAQVMFEATAIREYATFRLPTRLQTQQYAEALMCGVDPEDQADCAAAAVIGRAGTDAEVFVEEQVLHRSVGSQQIMADQLDHLIALVSGDGRVTVRIVPHWDTHTAASVLHSFRLLDIAGTTFVVQDDPLAITYTTQRLATALNALGAATDAEHSLALIRHARRRQAGTR